MEQTVKQRLITFLKYKKLGRNKFERQIGVSVGYISNLKSTPGADVLVKIFNGAPDLNREWLLTGEGEMLNAGEPSPPAATPTTEERLLTIIEKMQADSMKRTDEIDNALNAVAVSLSHVDRMLTLLEKNQTATTERNAV